MRSKTAKLIGWTTGGFLLVLAAFRAPAEVTYFLLSTRLVGSALGSCVLPLTKPEDIAEARREMTLDQPPLIPLVRITAGADGINRDYLAPGKPSWTWHVTGFVGFVEGVPEILESTPALVERRQGGWFHDSSGAATVAFTGYKPVAELTREQIFFASAQLTANGMDLHWVDLGANYLYTVETSSSFSPANWMPAPGGSWPIAGTNWVDIATPLSGPRFYRVKAELKSP